MTRSRCIAPAGRSRLPCTMRQIQDCTGTAVAMKVSDTVARDRSTANLTIWRCIAVALGREFRQTTLTCSILSNTLRTLSAVIKLPA